MSEPTVERVRRDRVAISLQAGPVRASLVAPIDADQAAVSRALHRLESVASREISAIADAEKDVPEDASVQSSGGKYEELLEGSQLRSAAEGS